MAYRDRDSIEQAFYLLIDGIDRAFFTRADAMAGVTLTGYTKHVGLREPSYEFGIDIREGWYTQSTASLVLDDVDEVLVGLFGTVTTEEALTANIHADYLPASVPPQVYGKHVGLERFGASGERHRFPWHPNDTAGHEHVAEDWAAGLGVASARVTSTAVLFAGRRFGLYRTIRRDDGTWLAHPVAVPVKGVEYAELRYWGTLRDAGTVRGRTWTLSVGGPESLLQRTLGQLTLREPTVANPIIDILPAERSIAAGVAIHHSASWFIDQSSNVVDDPTFGLPLIWPLQSQTMSASTAAAARTAINAALVDATAVNLDGTPGTTQDFYDSSGIISPAFRMNADNSVTIKAMITKATTQFASCRIIAHEKVWALLGYQVSDNGDEAAGDIDKNDARFVHFTPRQPSNVDGVSFGAGYWIGTMFGANPLAQDASEVGQGRLVQPYWPNGAAVWPNDVSSDPVEFDLITFEQAYVKGQHDVAPAEDPASPGDPYELGGASNVNSTRLALLSGVLRYAGTDEEQEFFQLARTSWTDSGDTIGAVGTYPRGVVTRWLQPELYGIENRGMDRPWAVSTDVEFATRATWVNHWSNADDNGTSQVNQICQRVLLSSGTSLGWVTAQGGSTPAYGDEGTIDRGDYDPVIGAPKDTEVADLGLAIPHELVADPDVWKEAVEVLPPALYTVIVASVGAIQADALLRGLTQGSGLCWGLRDGKYGIFDPWQPSSTTDFDATLGQAQMLRVGGDGFTQVDLRALAPIDVVKASVREKLTNPGSYVADYEVRASDRGAKFRTTGAEHSVSMPWHQARREVRLALESRWDLGFVWWSRRHFIARGIRIGRIPGQDLYPGSRVLVTDPWMVSQAGDYGVTNQPALVLSVSCDHDSEIYTIDLLVYEAPEIGQRVMAPEARVVAYDSATYTLQCLPDFRGAGGAHNDLSAFVKPSWASGLTGDLAIQVRQGTRFDPTKYDTLTGSVSSIDLDACTITLTGALSGGTWRRDAIKIITIRPYANQVEWARRVFYPIATEAGTVNGSAANVVPLPE